MNDTNKKARLEKEIRDRVYNQVGPVPDPLFQKYQVMPLLDIIDEQRAFQRLEWVLEYWELQEDRDD